MGLDVLYADSIDQGLQRWAANPGPAPEPGFSVTSFLGAGGKALPQAAMERGAAALDAMSGFGNILAATGGSAGGMFAIPSEAEQKQEAEARDRMLKGDNQSVESGNAIRRKAEEFAPDPLTASKADQVVNGLVRFGAKVVTDVGTMGPAGAIVTGLDEGENTTQNLRTQGVPTAAATKVGVVTGAFSAAGAVLPLGGKTVLQTLGLVAVGGPGSYIAQEALSRQILEKAGQYDQASLHNPFDPLGLSLSMFIPGLFGAVHMRGVYGRREAVAAGRVPLAQLTPQEVRGLKYDDLRLDAVASAAGEKYGVPPALVLAIKNAGEKSGPTAVSPKGATGVMQFTEGTAKEMGLADRTDPVASIDAGARYLKKLYDAYGSWDAAVAHYNGGGAQAVIVRGGGRPTYNETAGYLDRVRAYMADHTAEAAAKAPENVDAARVAVLNDTVARALPDTPEAHSEMLRAADIVGESSGRAAEAQIAPVRPEPVSIAEFPVLAEHADLIRFAQDYHAAQGPETVTLLHATNDVSGLVESQRFDTGRAGSGFGVPDTQRSNVFLAADRSTAESYLQTLLAAKERGADIPEPGIVAVTVKRGAGVAEGVEVRVRPDDVQSVVPVREYQPARLPKAAAEPTPVREADNSLPPADSVSLAGDQPAKRGAEVGSSTSEQQPKSASAKEKSAAAPDSSSASSTSPAATIDQQIAQKLATEQPDLQVVLPGTDARLTVAEALKRIAEDQKQDSQWADLVRVAADCALAG